MQMKPPVFEHKNCWKCGGKGRIPHYSYILGGVCFACGGAGYKLTKHGQLDHARYRAAVDAIALRKVADVKVGDFVRDSSMAKYAKVIAIEPAASYQSGHTVNGETVWTEHACVTLSYDRKVAVIGLPDSAPADCKIMDGCTTALD